MRFGREKTDTGIVWRIRRAPRAGPSAGSGRVDGPGPGGRGCGRDQVARWAPRRRTRPPPGPFEKHTYRARSRASRSSRSAQVSSAKAVESSTTWYSEGDAGSTR
ncbi:hypothetical protein GCM10027570_17290 [Streptomonospora sediminis]